MKYKLTIMGTVEIEPSIPLKKLSAVIRDNWNLDDASADRLWYGEGNPKSVRVKYGPFKVVVK